MWIIHGLIHFKGKKKCFLEPCIFQQFYFRNKKFSQVIEVPHETFWTEASVGYHLYFSSPQNKITNYVKYLPDFQQMFHLKDSFLE